MTGSSSISPNDPVPPPPPPPVEPETGTTALIQTQDDAPTRAQVREATVSELVAVLDLPPEAAEVSSPDSPVLVMEVPGVAGDPAQLYVVFKEEPTGSREAPYGVEYSFDDGATVQVADDGVVLVQYPNAEVNAEEVFGSDALAQVVSVEFANRSAILLAAMSTDGAGIDDILMSGEFLTPSGYIDPEIIELLVGNPNFSAAHLAELRLNDGVDEIYLRELSTHDFSLNMAALWDAREGVTTALGETILLAGGLASAKQLVLVTPEGALSETGSRFLEAHKADSAPAGDAGQTTGFARARSAITSAFAQASAEGLKAAAGLSEGGARSRVDQFVALYQGREAQASAVPSDAAPSEAALRTEFDNLMASLGPEAQAALDQLLQLQADNAGEQLSFGALDTALGNIERVLAPELDALSGEESYAVDFFQKQLVNLPKSASEHLVVLAQKALAIAPAALLDSLGLTPDNVSADLTVELEAFIANATPEAQQDLYMALSTVELLSESPWLFGDEHGDAALLNAQSALEAVAGFPILESLVGRLVARLEGVIDGQTPQQLADASGENLLAYMEQHNPDYLAQLLEGTTKAELVAEFSRYQLALYENPKIPLETRQAFFEFQRDLPGYLANTLSADEMHAFQVNLRRVGPIFELIPFDPQIKPAIALIQGNLDAIRLSNAADRFGQSAYDAGSYSPTIGSLVDDPPLTTVEIDQGQYTKIEAYLRGGGGEGAVIGDLETQGYEIRLDAEYGVVAYFDAGQGLDSGHTLKVGLSMGLGATTSVSGGLSVYDGRSDFGVGVYGSASAGLTAAFVSEASAGPAGVQAETSVGFSTYEIDYGGRVTLGAAGLHASGGVSQGIGAGYEFQVGYDLDSGVLTIDLNVEFALIFGVKLGLSLEIDINQVRGLDPAEERFLVPSASRQTSGSGNDTFYVPPLSPPGSSHYEVFYVNGQRGDDELVLPGNASDWKKTAVTEDPYGAQYMYRHTETGDTVYTINTESVRYETYTFTNVDAAAADFFSAAPDRFAGSADAFDALINFFGGGAEYAISDLAQTWGGNVGNLDNLIVAQGGEPDFHSFFTDYLDANVESVLTQFDANKDGFFDKNDATLLVAHLKAVDETQSLLAGFETPGSDEYAFLQALVSLGDAVTPERVQLYADRLAVDQGSPEYVIAIRDAHAAGTLSDEQALSLLSGKVPLEWVERTGLDPLMTEQFYTSVMNALILNGGDASGPAAPLEVILDDAKALLGESAFMFATLADDYAALLAERRDGLASGNPTPAVDRLDLPIDEWLPLDAEQAQRARANLGLGPDEPFPSVKEYLGLTEDHLATLSHFEANGYNVEGLILKTLSFPELTPEALRHNLNVTTQLMVVNGEDNTDDVLFNFLDTGNTQQLVLQPPAELDERALAEVIIHGGVQGIEGGADFQTRIEALAQSNPAEYERFMQEATAYFEIKQMLEGPEATFEQADLDALLAHFLDGAGLSSNN